MSTTVKFKIGLSSSDKTTMQSEITSAVTSAISADISGISSSVATIASDISAVSGNVDSLSSTVTSLSGTVTSLSGTVTNLASSVAGLATDVSTVSGNVTTLSTTVGSLSTSVGSLTTSVSSLSSAVSALSTTVANKQDALDASQTSAVNSGIDSTKVATYDGYSSSISTNTSSISSLATRVSAAESNISSVSNTAASAVSAATANASNISAISASLSSLSSTVSSLSTAVSTNTASITANASGITDLSSSVRAISADLSVISTSANELSETVSAMSTTVNSHASSISALDASMSTVTSNITALQSNVSDISGDISTLNTSVSELSTSVASAVPNTRTVNSKALSTDITLTASDILTDSQLSAVNSGITSTDVEQITANKTNIEVNTNSISALDVRLTAAESDITKLDERVTDLEKMTVPEYGIRWEVGSSSSAGTRVMRVNNVISTWDATFTANIGETVTASTFDDIDLFNPTEVTDDNGNVFMRFSRFYYLRETTDTYNYIWVCRKKLNDSYILPSCFNDFGIEWNYVDIGKYPASEETVTYTDDSGAEQTITCLVSKSGGNPRGNRTRTTSYTRAKNNETALKVDTTKERYLITTLSERTEIINKLLPVEMGTLNAQTYYQGVTTYGFDVYILASDVENGIVYITDNTQNQNAFNVGSSQCIKDTAYTAWDDPDNWYTVSASASVTGTITDGVFTEDSTGTAYLKVTLDKAVTETITLETTRIMGRPRLNGETDSIDALHGAVSNNGYHSNKFLGIENLWGNVHQEVLNCTISSLTPYISEGADLDSWTEATSSIASQSCWKAADYQITSSSGWITELGTSSTYPSVELPVTLNGSSSTYYADYCWSTTNTGNYTVYCGGYLFDGSNAGPIYWSLNIGVGSSSWARGARLSRRCL